MARTTPTSRSLSWFRHHGWEVDIVERRTGPVLHDLFGFADILAVHPTTGTLAFVQVTSGAHYADRVAKCLNNDIVPHLIKRGDKVWVMAWRLLTKQEDKRGVLRPMYKPKMAELVLKDGVVMPMEIEPSPIYLQVADPIKD